MANPGNEPGQPDTLCVVAAVVRIRPHPGAQRIWLADVDTGDGYVLQIVWGGVPVIRAGDMVPVVLAGGTIPGTGRKVRRRRYRGQVSEGVLCSAAELGWGSESDRVLVLGRQHGARAGYGLRPGDPLVARPGLGGCSDQRRTS